MADFSSIPYPDQVNLSLDSIIERDMKAWISLKRYNPAMGCNHDETGKPILTKEYMDYNM